MKQPESSDETLRERTAIDPAPSAEAGVAPAAGGRREADAAEPGAADAAAPGLAGSPPGDSAGAAPRAESSAVYCVACGASMDPQDVFCHGCGWRVGVPLPPPPVARPAEANPSEYSRLAALLLCVFLGFMGMHRFYVGKIGTGFLWLFTFGLFGIGAIYDLILVGTGEFRDRDGRRLVRWNDS